VGEVVGRLARRPEGCICSDLPNKDSHRFHQYTACMLNPLSELHLQELLLGAVQVVKLELLSGSVHSRFMTLGGIILHPPPPPFSHTKDQTLRMCTKSTDGEAGAWQELCAEGEG